MASIASIPSIHFGYKYTNPVPLNNALGLIHMYEEDMKKGRALKIRADNRTRNALVKRGFHVKQHGSEKDMCYVWLGNVERIHPMRVTRNMLDPNGKEFLIEEDTPSYCDPGCESYHSM